MYPRLARGASRALHTRPAFPRAGNQYSLRHLAFAAGCSTILASYFTYRLTADKHRLSLDGHSNVAVHKKPELKTPATPKTLEETTSSSSSALDHREAPLTTTTTTDSSTDASPTEEPDSGEENPEGAGGGGGAYNPETGEINWDCPCLGGMASGPCGPEFREAFSCFVHSEEEPKGIECVEKFKGMQTCFRAHPDVYGEDVMKDDDEDEGEAPQDDNTKAEAEVSGPATAAPPTTPLTPKSSDDSSS